MDKEIIQLQESIVKILNILDSTKDPVVRQRLIGRLEEATKNLRLEISGFRTDLQPVVRSISEHHEKLVKGSYMMKWLNSKIVIGFIWLALLTAVTLPRAWEAIKHIFKGLL